MGDNRYDLVTAKQIALVHVAKRDLKLTDDDYRYILRRMSGVESSADLCQKGFEKVMAFFTGLGFRSTWTKRTYGNRAGMASPKQVELIRSLWRKYVPDDETETGLNAWLDQFHKVSAVRFIDSVKAAKVIFALKAMTKRKMESCGA